MTENVITNDDDFLKGDPKAAAAELGPIVADMPTVQDGEP